MSERDALYTETAWEMYRLRAENQRLREALDDAGRQISPEAQAEIYAFREALSRRGEARRIAQRAVVNRARDVVRCDGSPDSLDRLSAALREMDRWDRAKVGEATDDA